MVLPQHVAATVIDNLGDLTHQPNASSSINQVYVFFNLQKDILFLYYQLTCLFPTSHQII